MEWECKGCGTILEITDGQKTAVCDFCGMENTLPSMDSEEKMQELIRANENRVAWKFDLAKKQYEKIIEKYPDDNEAYWCKILCVYGIEYVDDVTTERKIPTCHRTLKESIFDNKDYNLIMSRATKEEKAIYEAEAKEIDRIQKDILSNAANQQPYDIFICYKETDNNGRRTRDSQTASRIYTNLTDKGYKVFFAKVTLKELAGSKYEPIIYSALTSAKVMLVVTTSKEYVNAPWVRNEWSRFLEFMQTDYSKTIVPCISIMDAYDLPEDLAEFQALNTQDMDFTESLTRQIDSKFGKTTVNKTPENVTVTPTRSAEKATQEVQATTASPISKYLERIEIFLQDKEWAEADAYAEKVLDIDPKCVEAYFGKLLAELQVSKKENLKKCKLPFDKAKNYPKVLRYADAELKAFLENSIEYIKERNETERKEEIYKNAVAAMNGAVTEKDFKSAGEKFKTILEYKDAKTLAEQCSEKAEIAKIEDIYKQAVEILESVNTNKSVPKDKLTFKDKPGILDEFRIVVGYSDVDRLNKAISLFSQIEFYKDAKKLIKKCEDKIRIIKEKELNEHTKAENKRKDEIYKKAKAKMSGVQESNYNEAIEIFTTIIDWKDSKEEIEICKQKIESIEKQKEEKRIEEIRNHERYYIRYPLKKKEKEIVESEPILYKKYKLAEIYDDCYTKKKGLCGAACGVLAWVVAFLICGSAMNESAFFIVAIVFCVPSLILFLCGMFCNGKTFAEARRCRLRKIEALNEYEKVKTQVRELERIPPYDKNIKY